LIILCWRGDNAVIDAVPEVETIRVRKLDVGVVLFWKGVLEERAVDDVEFDVSFEVVNKGGVQRPMGGDVVEDLLEHVGDEELTPIGEVAVEGRERCRGGEECEMRGYVVFCIVRERRQGLDKGLVEADAVFEDRERPFDICGGGADLVHAPDIDIEMAHS